jgi:predicted ATP-grasp superfamily ATP-dependent carboligase
MREVRSPSKSDEVPRERKVLAITGDTQVGLSMLRSLAKNGLSVFAVCNSDQGQSAHSRHCAGAWVLDRSQQAKPAWEQVLALARQLDAGSVMPISESLHAALIENRHHFEPGIHVFSPDRDAFEQASDKDAMHRLCLEMGIPVARGTTLDKLLSPGGASLRFPLVLRTRRQGLTGSAAPWKAAYARDEHELERLVAEVGGFADNVLVQEYHPGVEDHVHVLMHDGRPFMIGEYVGEYHAPLAGGVTVQRVSCCHRALQNDAVKLLQSLRWQGIATVQFHYDPATEEYIFLEINPRMCGGQPTVIRAGFDSPFLLWQSHFEPEAMRPAEYRLGLRTRILGGSINWMLGMIGGESLPPDQRRLPKWSALTRFLWNCGPWTKDDSFEWSDPLPFFVDIGQMFQKRVLSSARRKAGTT